VTVAEALDGAARRLGSFDARILLEEASGAVGGSLFAHPERELDPACEQRFEAWIGRRALGEPVAYITGRVGFYGRTLAVDPRVLVPRPETEHLVEAVLDHLRGARSDHARRIADVGTGCGAIAITLAAENPTSRVIASDISSEALDVARENARRLGVAERIVFVQGDLVVPLRAGAPYDAVVANLPYVPTAQIPAVPNPVGFEPRIALDGGRDGLVQYRRLLAAAPSIIASGGALFLEAAPDTIEELAALAQDALGGGIEIGTDYSGLDRYVVANVAEREDGR
jgi:release factor glutamine methyltransferase